MNKASFEGVIAALWLSYKPVIGNHPNECADLQIHTSFAVPRWRMVTRRPKACSGRPSLAAEPELCPRGLVPSSAQRAASQDQPWCTEVVSALRAGVQRLGWTCLACFGRWLAPGSPPGDLLKTSPHPGHVDSSLRCPVISPAALWKSSPEV